MSTDSDPETDHVGNVEAARAYFVRERRSRLAGLRTAPQFLSGAAREIVELQSVISALDAALADEREVAQAAKSTGRKGLT